MNAQEPKPNIPVIKKWVKFLRDIHNGKHPKYRQGRGALCRGPLTDGCTEFCAQGVLCELHRLETNGDAWTPFALEETPTTWQYHGCAWLPSSDVVAWACGDERDIKIGGYNISRLNDFGKGRTRFKPLSFAEIADLIEAHFGLSKCKRNKK